MIRYGLCGLLLGLLLGSACAAPPVDNPLVTKHPILYVLRKQYKPDHHNTETMFQKGEINEASFEGGSALKTVNLATGEVKTLLESPQGIIRDPDVSFDGKKILFSMRKDAGDAYHIYELNADGSELKQLTRAQGITDIDPIYLPDGGILFSATREPKYCMCNRHIMANLYRMEGDGANIHQIGKSTLFEGHAALMPDGRVLYDRWEYVDRNFGDAQGLWTVYPDGSGHAVYWGNNTNSPGAVLEGKPIPGTEEVICNFSSCHDRPWGAIAIIDRRLGLDGKNPVIRTWPKSAIDLVGQGDFDTFKQVEPKYEDPFPLSDRYFLCARATGRGEEMAICLLDREGDATVIHEEAPGCFDPMPLAPRPRPPVLPERRDFETGEGTFYVADVYVGTHMQGVERGAVKSLRVVESPEKRFWTQPSWNGQGQEAPAMNWNDFSNKRVLGTVPVEADGSAYFKVPAGKFVYFQLLDANGMMVQSMRSGTIIQPGERQGCTGCHEERRSAPPAGTATPAALVRPPSTLEGWYGPARTFNFRTEVQPVFDKHCVRCHDFGQPAGDKLNLSGDRSMTFNVAYAALWRRGWLSAVGAGPAETKPAYSWGSNASSFVAVIKNGHKDVQLDPESFDRIVTWIDLNAPYYPEYASAFPGNLSGRCPLNPDQVARLGKITGIDFNALADCAANTGAQVDFDRPELSPCLDVLRERSSKHYDEALEIIRAGQAVLAQHPDVDSTGFALEGMDAAREQRYEARQQCEQRNCETIRAGGKVYDE